MWELNELGVQIKEGLDRNSAGMLLSKIGIVSLVFKHKQKQAETEEGLITENKRSATRRYQQQNGLVVEQLDGGGGSDVVSLYFSFIFFFFFSFLVWFVLIDKSGLGCHVFPTNAFYCPVAWNLQQWSELGLFLVGSKLGCVFPTGDSYCVWVLLWWCRSRSSGSGAPAV